MPMNSYKGCSYIEVLSQDVLLNSSSIFFSPLPFSVELRLTTMQDNRVNIAVAGLGRMVGHLSGR